MQSSIIFALCVALSATLYQVFQRQVAGVNAYLVALVVSATAIVFGGCLAIFGGKIAPVDFSYGKVSWLFLVLIGVCAFGIDFFTAKAYTAGGDVSLISPIIVSGIVVFSGVFGALFFKESLTWFKIAGILFIALGAFLASWKK